MINLYRIIGRMPTTVNPNSFWMSVNLIKKKKKN
jgi:hypothetical protein